MPIGIDLRAVDETDPSALKPPVVSVIHEMVHWISAPPGQGEMTIARGMLGANWTEGLVEVVTEDLMSAQGIPVHADDGEMIHHQQNDIQVYPDGKRLAKKLIDSVGVEPVGDALFSGQLTVLANAIMSRWNWTPQEFIPEFRKLIVLIDGSQYNTASDRIDALNKVRPKVQAATPGKT